MTGKEIAKLRKEKMRNIISEFVKEQIANVNDMADYFDTSKDVVLTDLEFLGLSEADVTKDTNKELMNFLIKKKKPALL